MATGKKVQRYDVLNAANAHGWQLDALIVDDSNLIRDLFTRDGVGIIRTVWIRTPWSPAGRWAGAVFSAAEAQVDRNIWTLGGRNSLLALLTGTSSDA